MLNFLLVPFVKQFGFLRIFNYISFRAAGAAVTALVVSFIVAYVVVAWFMRWVRTRGFVPFAVYRILAGTAVLWWAFHR